MDSNTDFFFYNKMKITNSDVSCMWLFVRHKVGYLVNKKHCVMVFKKKKNTHLVSIMK